MAEKSTVSVQVWPGGIRTISGGTRTEIKIDRPWQKPMDINPDVCPFEPGVLESEHEITLRSEDGSWTSFENLHTPNQFHRVVVPATCTEWPDDRLRRLGGREEVGKALDLAHRTLEKNKRTNRGQEHIINHNGHSAGQNQPHIHWHALTFLEEARGDHPYSIQQQLLEVTADPSFLISANGNLKVVAGGHRAGECFILPFDPQKLVSLENIANVLYPLIELFALKFRSRVGAMLPPDFTVDLIFVLGVFAYGAFVPILNNIGSTEFTAFLGQQAVTLPWSHKATAAYLRGERGLKE